MDYGVGPGGQGLAVLGELVEAGVNDLVMVDGGEVGAFGDYFCEGFVPDFAILLLYFDGEYLFDILVEKTQNIDIITANKPYLQVSTTNPQQSFFQPRFHLHSTHIGITLCGCQSISLYNLTQMQSKNSFNLFRIGELEVILEKF